MIRKIFTLMLVLPILVICQVKNEQKDEKREKAMSLQIKSTAFKDGEDIPKKYTCDAEDVSPQLSWENVPNGTKSFAIICDDPDAPVGTWVHWVIFGISANITELPENIGKDKTLKNGAKQGINDFGKIGYGGPCPPRGPKHRYFFKLYALNTDVKLNPGATKSDLLKAMEGHILVESQLMGKYGR